jgi:hypothetical protein
MMAFKKAVARWKEVRQRMKEILERLRFGESKIEPWPPIPGQVDTTPGDIARYEQKITEMDALIARHPEAK